MMIPNAIKKEHILKAINEVKRNGVPLGRQSRKFSLKYDDELFPPKYLISLACKYATGRELHSEGFSGGIESNDCLKGLGFDIVKVSSDKKIPSKITHQKKTPRQKKPRHDERCPDCKEMIRLLLQKVYGQVETNYKFNLGTHPDDHRSTEYHDVLKQIYEDLQNHRYFHSFVRTRTLPHCDFYVPEPGIIVEFDESQHFTKPRAITLKRYPNNVKWGFDKQTWLDRCLDFDARDNDPPYRDEQRAWYDTLRDFCSLILNKSIVRLLPDEAEWCSFDLKKKHDVEKFEAIIQRKLDNLNLQNLPKQKASVSSETFNIGLAFPELNKHDFSYFYKILSQNDLQLSLIIFPEGFETIKPSEETSPENISSDPQVIDLIRKYYSLCQKRSIGVIVGIQVDYENSLLSGGDNDQYCLFISPGGDNPYIYHKHSTSRHNAFFDSNWSIARNLRTVRLDSVNIGITVCHDSYISLISRALKRKGANIWINISYQNVNSEKWESIHHSRAIENSFISLCTLHRNSKKKKNRQKEPYAFSTDGKIILRDLKSQTKIESIPPEKRTGKVYYFDLNRFATSSMGNLRESEISEKASILSIRMRNRREIWLDDNDFVIKEIDIHSFIFLPEKLWKICLEHKNKVVLFIVRVNNMKGWKQNKNLVENIIKGRTIEFSSLFLFLTKNNDILIGSYRSSNYKDCRLFYPRRFPVNIDSRYLKGLESTYEISLRDYRNCDESIYFDRIEKLISFIDSKSEK